MITRSIIEQNYYNDVIRIEDEPTKLNASIFIDDEYIPLYSVKSLKTHDPIQMSAEEYTAKQFASDILEDIEHSFYVFAEDCDVQKYEKIDRILNAADRFDLPYVRRPEIMIAAEKAFGIDTQMDRAIEEMSELIQSLLKLKRYAKNSSGEKLQKLKEHVNEEIGDVLLTITHMIMMYGDKDKIQKSMDYKMSRLNKQIKEKTNKEKGHI